MRLTPKLTTSISPKQKSRELIVVNLMRNFVPNAMQYFIHYNYYIIDRLSFMSKKDCTLNSKNMETIDIHIPNGIRYMSDYLGLMDILPQQGKYILNKQLTGCGGTTLFLHSQKPLVLVSPRTNILISKSKQTPGSHLFRDKKSADVNTLKAELRNYLMWCQNPFEPTKSKMPKILVTVDSFKYVLEVLDENQYTDDFLFLVDEFQNQVSDATFKGKTDMEFLSLIDSHCKNIVYMSATPVQAVYLDHVQQFKGLRHFMLKWNPNVLETPNIKEVQMKPPYNTLNICASIIAGFRQNGYFEKKIYNGQECYSREICIFLNEVKTIKQIIERNNLQPSEVTILVSESNKYAKALEQNGFRIGGLSTNKKNPKNKPFTFCSKSSFEGTDFYSTNAVTAIFLDGSRTSQSLSLEIDLPQIMGRQRLDCNPFRRDATLYYKIKENPQTITEVELEQSNMLNVSNTLLDSLKGMNETARDIWANKLRAIPESERYKNDYVDVFDTLNGYEFNINWLAFVAKMDIWHRQKHFYSNPIYLLSGVEQGLSQTSALKPTCLMDFERYFYQTASFQVRMKLFMDFITTHPEHLTDVLYNPYIPNDLYEYYCVVGSQYIKSVSYREKEIKSRYAFLMMQPQIQTLCTQCFISKQFYTNSEVKEILQGVYNKLGFAETAKATDITAYIPTAKVCMRTINGNRVSGFEIP